MNEFWLWFIRPIAEAAGVLAAVAAGLAIIFAVRVAVTHWPRRRL